MPIYEFRCRDCGKAVEEFAPHTDIPSSVECDGCVNGTATRVFSKPMVPIIDNVLAKSGRKRRKNPGDDLAREHQPDSAALARAIR